MSLQLTYQSRKDLIASNLTSQGVTASGSEGLTRLANKILDIDTPTVLYNDDSTTDNSSNYNLSNATLTYDSTNQCYLIYQNTTSNRK